MLRQIPRRVRELETHTVNPTVTILIRFTNHFVDLIIGQFLSDGSHDMTKLSRRDESVVVSIEDLESFLSIPLEY